MIDLSTVASKIRFFCKNRDDVVLVCSESGLAVQLEGKPSCGLVEGHSSFASVGRETSRTVGKWTLFCRDC